MKIYPVKIEATESDGNLLFTVEACDQYSATINLQQTIHSEISLEELIDGLRKAFKLLELKP